MRLHSTVPFAPLTALLALTLLAGCGGGGAGNGPEPRTIGGARTITIQLQPGTDPEALAQELSATVTDRVPERNLYRLRLPDTDSPAAIAQRLRLDPRLVSAEENDAVGTAEAGVEGNPIHVPFDFVKVRDANYGAIGAGGSVNQGVYSQIHLGQTHALTKGAGVVVAVLDTGVRANHSSLTGHILPGYNALDESQTADDVQDGDTNAEWGHGTMVAGIIVRLAPDAKILPVRVLNADGSGTVIDVVQGIRWAVAHGAQVINLSLGTRFRSEALEEAIADAHDAGCTVVAAAGNSGIEAPQYPAAFGDVVAVAALESDDTKAPYSNYGSFVRIAAPGTGIRSTFADGGYAAWSGTSFAAPIVAASAALVRAAHPGWTGDQVAEAIQSTARTIAPQNPTLPGKLGNGIVDLERAVTGATP